MSPWKNRIVVVTFVALCISLPVFLLAGYSALYWGWLRGNLESALPYLPWARNSGAFALAGATAAFAILFSSDRFPISPRTRLWLSLLATATIGSFAEFRNEGKFYFKGLVHFFGPGTWIHLRLNQVFPALGDFLYRAEYSHWNDFLMGPAIVSVLFSLVFAKLYAAFWDQGPLSLNASAANVSTGLESTLRFARTLMLVGLFWFFIQAWLEKAGYLRSPHSSDEIDLPFEFAGTMLGFWMARMLTKPFGQHSEKFRSTFLIDFVSSGVIGLAYTLVVGPLTEGVAGAVAHGLYPAVPGSLEVHEYTQLQRLMRPLELLLLAGALWWGLNRLPKNENEPLTLLGGTYQDTPEFDFKWDVTITIAQALGATIAYLLLLVTLLSILEPEGLAATLATAAVGMGGGTAALWLVKRTAQARIATVFNSNDDRSTGA